MKATAISLPPLTIDDVVQARTTPEDIREPHGGKYQFPGAPILVYGSNDQGMDGAGSARVARDHWHRPPGVGRGYAANQRSPYNSGTFGIATKDHPYGQPLALPAIKEQLDALTKWAAFVYQMDQSIKDSPAHILHDYATGQAAHLVHSPPTPVLFLVTAIGCGRAGYSALDIAPMCSALAALPNVWLPKSFWTVLRPRLVIDRISHHPLDENSPSPAVR